MKKYFYTSILSLFFLIGCSSEFTEEPNVEPEVPTDGIEDLLISEIATAINTDPNGGGKRNHYVELYNGTGKAIDLSDYAIGYQATSDETTLAEWSFTNAADYLQLSGSLNQGKAYVIGSNAADPATVKSDVTWGTSSTANADASLPLQLSGNSAIALLKKDAAGTHTLNGVKYKIIDAFGSPKVARVTAATSSGRNNLIWSIAGESTETRNNTFFRKKTTKKPNADWAVSKGTTAVDSEWIISGPRAWDYSNIGLFTVADAPTGPTVPTNPFQEMLISEIATFINTDNSKRNHYIELYNGTDNAIDLSNYAIGYQATSDETTLTDWSFTNPENYLLLSGSVASTKTHVIASVQADPAIVKSDTTWGTTSTANADASKPLQLSGNSAIALLKKDAAGTHTLNGVKYKIIDVFGSPQVPRVTATASSSSRNNFMWDIAGEKAETRNNTIFRKKTITKPNTDWSISKGTSAENSEWILSAPRTWDYSNIGLFTVATATPPPTNPFQEMLISEIATFINTDSNAGSKRNHYVELYNGTDNAIDLSNYAIGYQATSDEATLTDWSFTDPNNYLLLTGSVASTKTHVIASVQADATFVKGDVTWGTSSTANADASKPLQLSGNSAIALLKKDAAGTHTLNGVKYKIIDVFGSPQVPRVTATASSSSRNNFMWDIAGEKAETRNNTIFRKKTITKPNTDWTKSKGTSTTDSEWILSAARSWDYTNIGKYTE